MNKMLLHWIITALAVWITSNLVSGFYVSGVVSALIAAIAIGFINATLGLALKVITFPFTIVTFGLFWLVINGMMLGIAAALVPGFYIRSFSAAFWGAIVLSLINLLLRKLLMPRQNQ
jgi:putative membrane protein